MIESGSSTKASLLISLQTQDLDSFSNTLKTTKLDLNKFVDPGGFNIFHDFSKTLMKEYQMVPYLSLLISEFKLRHPPNILVEMLNSLTVKEKQTPLHLAAKFNKLKLVIEYIKHGANPALKDELGQTVLHLAAKSGNVGIFAYLYCNYCAEINVRDINNSTPLHLAVTEAHENMAFFLISIIEDLELKDNKGYTALHLTTINSAYKIARHLVMRGANRHTKCDHGQTPLDLAVSRGSTDMYKVLKEPGIITNPCKMPIKKIGRKRYISHIVLLVIRAGLIVLLILPYFNIFIFSVVLSLEAMNLVLFFVVSFMDPGYENTKTSLSELYATIKPDFICPYCTVKKTQSTVHCHHCNKCVKKFDHHCPWMNNCIGEKNQKVFVFYLLILCLNLSASITVSWFYFLDIMVGSTFYTGIRNLDNGYVGIVVSVLCMLVILLVFPLLWIQVGNLLFNKTSRLKYSYKQGGLISSLSSTSSILLKDSEDWSIFSKKIEIRETIEEGCCKKKTIKTNSNTGTIQEDLDH